MEIITTHKNVDFDALGSVFAASILYPQATPILPVSLNPNTRAFLSLHKDIFAFNTSKEINPVEAKKLIVVDTNSWTRLEGMDRLPGKSDLEIHLWDHHPEKGDIKADWSCHELVGATSTLFAKRLEERQEEISPILATLFLAGIYEDTGHLTFPTTTAADAKSVGFLLEQKADLNIVKNFLRPIYGPKQKDLLFEMLKDVKRQKLNGYTVSLAKAHIKGHTPGLSLVVNMFQDIVNVDAAFGIFIEAKRDQCLVIGRSSDDSLDIGSIMRNMGGGGHPNAGSAIVKPADPQSAAEWIIEMIKEGHQSSIQIGDLMSSPVFTVAPKIKMKKVALLLREKGCTGIPVVDGEAVVGIISRRDFRKIKKSPQLDLPVKAFMSTRLFHIGPEKNVGQAVRLMVKNDIGRLPVVKNERLIGIITRSDVMQHYYCERSG